MNLVRKSPAYACGDSAYMDQLYQALEALGCTRSDAQGIADAAEEKIAWAYAMGTTPDHLAASLFNPLAVPMAAPPVDPVPTLPSELAALNGRTFGAGDRFKE
jgi:hypothetical protein